MQLMSSLFSRYILLAKAVAWKTIFQLLFQLLYDHSPALSLSRLVASQQDCSIMHCLAKCHSIQDCWLLRILLVVCLAPRKGSPESPHRETWVGSVSWAAVSRKAPGGPALQKTD